MCEQTVNVADHRFITNILPGVLQCELQSKTVMFIQGQF